MSRVLSGHFSVRSHLGRVRNVEDLMSVCADDYETVKDSGWNVSIGIPIRYICLH
jgi:hypothetical protein